MRDKIWRILVVGNAFSLKTPSTFFTWMNNTFHPNVDKFVVVYFDDIVIYSNTLEEHIEHLRIVFQFLRENHLYVKWEMCEFTQH